MSFPQPWLPGPQLAVMPAVETAKGFAKIAKEAVTSMMKSARRKPEEIEMDILGADRNKIAQDKIRAQVDEKTAKERKDAQVKLLAGPKTAGKSGKQVFDVVISIFGRSASAPLAVVLMRWQRAPVVCCADPRR